ncbi:MAG TPA: trypsin-like peptidase domain-containing protein [Acidobacteriaceae bacterium]|nr:trypsin-like peptidase domain-containing protein [Acidobacteriaceae bacterium]
MKARLLILTLAILGGFYIVTTHTASTGSGGGWFIHTASTAAQPKAEDMPSGLQMTEAEAAPALLPSEQNNIEVYKKALPSVVNITSNTVTFDFFYGAVPAQGQGSGFILDKKGDILTNYHVVSNAQNVQVTLYNKHQYKARILMVDKGHDLALLKIDAPDLQPATLADSRGLQVGQLVYAIGNPFGLSGTMTRGIISSIRSVRGPMGNLISDAIQTDAAINPGNSGGPLLNSQGNVIGMNTMIDTGGGANQNAGIGFSIPIDTAKAALNDFFRYGKVLRPTLGIRGLSIGPDIANQMGLPAIYGVLVERIVPGGPADHAGIHGGTQQAYLGNTPIYIGGDLIVAIDGDQVTNDRDIAEIMDGHQAGQTVTVTIYRGQKRMNIKVILGNAGNSGDVQV